MGQTNVSTIDEIAVLYISAFLLSLIVPTARSGNCGQFPLCVAGAGGSADYGADYGASVGASVGADGGAVVGAGCVCGEGNTRQVGLRWCVDA